MSKTLREKIAKDGQLKFGYVDWEVETQSTIDRWHEHADFVLTLIRLAIEGVENPYAEGCIGYAARESMRQAILQRLGKENDEPRTD